MKKILFCTLFILSTFLLFDKQSYAEPPYSEGFSANWVDIQKLNNGKFRVIIKYTNLKIGEYREAYADFDSKKQAIDVFQKLALGANFYWGDTKTIYFEKEVEKPKPY